MPLGREVKQHLNHVPAHQNNERPGRPCTAAVCLAGWLLLLVVTTAVLSQVWSVGLSPLTSFVFPARCAMYL